METKNIVLRSSLELAFSPPKIGKQKNEQLPISDMHSDVIYHCEKYEDYLRFNFNRKQIVEHNFKRPNTIINNK